MVDTYSSKPFISYDGLVDGKRAEVHVVKGFGHVHKVQASERGKSTNVAFAVDNTKHFPSGWSRDEKVIALVKKAEASGEPIHFRIETRRQDHIDRTIPIEQLRPLAVAAESIVKSLAAVKFADDEDWTISSDAVTRLDEDPHSGGPVSAYNNSPEELQAARGDTPSTPAAHGRKGEAPPFAVYNNDGSLNLGSVAISAPLNVFSFVLEFERDHDLELTGVARKKLAKAVFEGANRLQLSIYRSQGQRLEKPDLTAGSHTRARALMFETIRTYYPLTVELSEDDEKLAEWSKLVLKTAHAMWTWGVEEANSVL